MGAAPYSFHLLCSVVLCFALFFYSCWFFYSYCSSKLEGTYLFGVQPILSSSSMPSVILAARLYSPSHASAMQWYVPRQSKFPNSSTKFLSLYLLSARGQERSDGRVQTNEVPVSSAITAISR